MLKNNLKSLIWFQKKVKFLLDDKAKKKINYIIVFQVFITLLEMIGIGLIFPILKVITDPTYLLNNYYLNQLTSLMEIEREILGYYLIILLFIFLLLKNFIIILFIYIKGKLIYDVFYNIRSKLFYNYLSKDFNFFINKTPAKLIKNVSQESNTFLRVFEGIISTYSEIFLISGTIAVLLLLSFKITFFILFFFLFFLLIFLKIFKRKLQDLGIQRENLDGRFLETLQNGIYSFRELFFYNCKEFFLNKFNFVNKKLRNNLMVNFAIGQSIRIFIEQFALILIGLSIFALLIMNLDIRNYIPIFGIIFYSFFKILPSFNKLVLNMQLFLTSQKGIDVLVEEFDHKNLELIKNKESDINKKFEFKDRIKVDDLSFKYQENITILKNINMEIVKNEKLGIVGKTGSGKSSLLYVLMGLINFNMKGKITVDGIDINEIRKDWFNKIGYVSQDNILLDYNLMENITYESDPKKIDKLKYKNALTNAELEDFLDTYHNRNDLKIGSKGISVSGGEGQRVSLARALYKNSEVLFLDEFTNSLDTLTENKIIENLSKLNKTMIIVSHKLSSLSICDRIYEIEDGKINQIK